MSLDQEKAFDSVSHIAILEGFMRENCSSLDIHLVSNFLGRHELFHRYMIHPDLPLELIRVLRGSPAGEILSPFLFSVAIALIFRNENKNFIARIPAAKPIEAPIGTPIVAPNVTATVAPVRALIGALVGAPTVTDIDAPSDAPIGALVDAPIGTATVAPLNAPIAALMNAPNMNVSVAPMIAPNGALVDASNVTPIINPIGASATASLTTPQHVYTAAGIGSQCNNNVMADFVHAPAPIMGIPLVAPQGNSRVPVPAITSVPVNDIDTLVLSGTPASANMGADSVGGTPNRGDTIAAPITAPIASSARIPAGSLIVPAARAANGARTVRNNVAHAGGVVARDVIVLNPGEDVATVVGRKLADIRTRYFDGSDRSEIEITSFCYADDAQIVSTSFYHVSFFIFGPGGIAECLQYLGLKLNARKTTVYFINGPFSMDSPSTRGRFVAIPGDCVFAESTRKSLGSLHQVPRIPTQYKPLDMKSDVSRYESFFRDPSVQLDIKLNTIRVISLPRAMYETLVSPSSESTASIIRGHSHALRLILDAHDSVPRKIMENFFGIRSPELTVTYIRLLQLMYSARTHRARHGQVVTRLLTLAYRDPAWNSIDSVKACSSLVKFFLYWVGHVLSEGTLTPTLPPPTLHDRVHSAPRGIMTLFIGDGNERFYDDEVSRKAAKAVFRPVFERVCGVGLKLPPFLKTLGSGPNAGTVPYIFAFTSNHLPSSISSFASPMLCPVCGVGRDTPRHLAMCPRLRLIIADEHKDYLVPLANGNFGDHTGTGALHSAAAFGLAAQAVCRARESVYKNILIGAHTHPCHPSGISQDHRIPSDTVDGWDFRSTPHDQLGLPLSMFLRKLGLKRTIHVLPEDVSDDGLCVFRALAVLLGYDQVTDSEILLRNSIASFMHSNTNLCDWGVINNVQVHFTWIGNKKNLNTLMKEYAERLLNRRPSGYLAEVLIAAGVLFHVHFEILYIDPCPMLGARISRAMLPPNAGQRGFRFAGTIIVIDDHAEALVRR